MGTVIGVVLGAQIGFVGTYLNHCLLLPQERKKEARSVIANVARALGGMCTIMESISWLGTYDPKWVNDEKIGDCENRLETHPGNLFGEIALVAVHERQAYEALSKQAKEANRIDEQIAKAIDARDSDRKSLFVSCQAELKMFHESWTKEIEAGLRKL